MKGSGYWRERYIKLGERMSAKGEGYYKALQGEYEKAFESIEKDIQSFYNRFAADNKLTYAEASKLLTSSERKKFQMSVDEYIKKGAANGVSLDWTRELRNASGVYHISRLKALQMQIQNEIETIAAKKLKGMGGLFEDAYREGYYRSLYELQKGMGHGAAFSTLDTRRIETAMGMVYGEDGLNFSERIWKDRRALAQTLKTEFPQMIIRGENPEKLVKLLSDKFEVSKAAARRLIRTESAFLSSYAAKESFEETGVKEFEVVVALDGRTCQSACAPLDGMHRPLSEYEIWVTAPPFHHNCRCVAVPYFNDEFTEGEERAARDTETGKTYYVPSDMTYKEWYDKHVAPKEIELPYSSGVEGFLKGVALNESTKALFDKYLTSENVVIDENYHLMLSYNRRIGKIIINPKYENWDKYDIVKSLTHEIVHFIDDNYGLLYPNIMLFSEKMPEAGKIIMADRKKYEKLFGDGGKYEYNMSLSDIFSCLTDNKIKGAFRHADGYWAKTANKERELTADLLTEYIVDDVESLELIRGIEPLDDILKGLVDTYGRETGL